eukprot:1143374-Pelagomonas_calceolata.AAC.4
MAAAFAKIPASACCPVGHAAAVRHSIDTLPAGPATALFSLSWNGIQNAVLAIPAVTASAVPLKSSIAHKRKRVQRALDLSSKLSACCYGSIQIPLINRRPSDPFVHRENRSSRESVGPRGTCKQLHCFCSFIMKACSLHDSIRYGPNVHGAEAHGTEHGAEVHGAKAHGTDVLL